VPPLRDLQRGKVLPPEGQIVIIPPEEVLMKVVAGHPIVMDHRDHQTTAVEDLIPHPVTVRGQEALAAAVEVVPEVVNL
tara:strand:- start:444 stop:680 length:237 start_codon:yes stop_codon:yes gene_type:complete